MTLDEIEARANAASPGPWTEGEERWGTKTLRMVVRDASGLAVANVLQDPANKEGRAPNARLIAAAREDVPILCAEVRRLRKAMIAALDAAREGFPLPADSWIRILTHALGDDAPKWPEPRRKP